MANVSVSDGELGVLTSASGHKRRRRAKQAATRFWAKLLLGESWIRTSLGMQSGGQPVAASRIDQPRVVKETSAAPATHRRQLGHGHRSHILATHEGVTEGVLSVEFCRAQDCVANYPP
jgi:hypothetical protein